MTIRPCAFNGPIRLTATRVPDFLDLAAA